MALEYLAIDSLKAGISGGIIGAVLIFLTTLTGMSGYSNAASFIKKTIFGKYGYTVSFFGAIWGAVLGFIYGFLIWWFFALIYNALI